MHLDTVQKFNIISQDTIDQLLDYYNNQDSYDTSIMNKAGPGEFVKVIQPLVEDILGRSVEYVIGNFYKHVVPYLPHTDYKTYDENSINVVVPLQYKEKQPSLVIFDQTWDLDSLTWCMHLPVQYFTYNIGVKGCPYEYPVNHLTNLPIDNSLYKEFLSHYPVDSLFGLSGSAFPFEPKSIIIFDNKKIHCTSKMYGEKIGLSLRFK